MLVLEAINSVGVIDFVVGGPSQQINQTVINSLTVTNTTAAIGGANQMTPDEIRNYISFNFAAQNRGVSINDYVSKLRTMACHIWSTRKSRCYRNRK